MANVSCNAMCHAPQLITENESNLIIVSTHAAHQTNCFFFRCYCVLFGASEAQKEYSILHSTLINCIICQTVMFRDMRARAHLTLHA